MSKLAQTASEHEERPLVWLVWEGVSVGEDGLVGFMRLETHHLSLGGSQFLLRGIKRSFL